jgi:diphthamide synthase (EF-2-diphthine--ammonia ligase)
MNFSMSYSFGKNSAFALYKMIKAGHKPVCLITTVNKDSGKSWTHGIEYY